jgi:hypothetical protein
MTIFFKKYLKYKNKYLMLKNMIGGNFDYLKTYVPKNVEFNYVKIDNGFDFKEYNQFTQDEDIRSFYEDISENNLNRWKQNLKNKGLIIVQKFIDQLNSTDPNIYDIVKKVLLNNTNNIDDLKIIKTYMENMKKKRDEISMPNLIKEEEAKEAAFDNFINTHQPTQIDLSLYNWEMLKTEISDRKDFQKKNRYDQNKILDKIFTWGKEFYDEFKQILLNRLNNDYLQSQIKKLSNQANSVYIQKRKEYDDILLKEEEERERKAPEFKEEFLKYKPKSPSENCDQECLKKLLLNLPAGPSKQYHIKIPNFTVIKDLEKLKNLLDKLNKFDIADSYKKIVDNLYQIQKLEDASKPRNALSPKIKNIMFPSVLGWRMTYYDDQHKVKYGSEIIEELKKIQELLTPPDQKYFILDGNSFQYMSF